MFQPSAKRENHKETVIDEECIMQKCLLKPNDDDDEDKNDNYDDDEDKNDNYDDDEHFRIRQPEFLSSIVLCATCTLINAVLCFFTVEKKRMWINGHILPIKDDLAEFGYLISFFLSFSGSILALAGDDFFWLFPGTLALLISNLIYAHAGTKC
jgi:hypothetical protein